MSTITNIIYGDDRSGIIKDVSSWIYEQGGNILNTDYYRQEKNFFQKIDWQTNDNINQEELQKNFIDYIHSIGLNIKYYSSYKPQKNVVIMCSKQQHCIQDLILRWKNNFIDCNIVGVISNHIDLKEWVEFHDIPFYHIPIKQGDPNSKKHTEEQQLQVIKSLDAHLIVMARYMQILSPKFIAESPIVINIHHSFLPAFIGAKPYHQAYERGVKIIGATAHYATETLDEGPIIHQEVNPISHHYTVQNLISLGRDLEKSVLAYAVKLHLENRVLTHKKRTIIFN